VVIDCCNCYYRTNYIFSLSTVMRKTFSSQYTRYIRSPEWRYKSKAFKAATGDRCVLLPWLKANHAHHLHYQNLESEEFARDCVPLHSKCHSFVHWIYDRKIPWLRNLLDFYLRAIARLLSIYARFEKNSNLKRY
jgi:hypothetical protein